VNAEPRTHNGKRIRIERFKDIEAWQLARELTRKVYGVTKKAKFTRDFGTYLYPVRGL